MFTGIVEEFGTVTATAERPQDAAVLTITGPLVSPGLNPGDSIAVNGACLTVTEHGPDWFTAELMATTLRHTSLRGAGPGTRVNLERPVGVADRLGGHVVQGHVDDTATVINIEPTPHWTVVRLAPPPALARYIADRGSVALDGVSLTVSALGDDGDTPWFEVSLIPTTLAKTTLGSLQTGDIVNLEVDILAKYVERLATTTPQAVAR